jgi:hypothetical protein
MAPPAQIAANRLNSSKSTGPKSSAALTVTRFNALKLGIDAKARVIPGEDPAEFEALAESYRQHFEPASPVEVALLDSLVSADWELRRLRKIEPKLFSEDAFLDPDSKEAKRLARFYRRLDTVERSYYRALKELRIYVDTRVAIEQEQAAQQTAGQAEAAIEAAANEKLASFLNLVCPPPESLNLSFAPKAPSAATGPISVPGGEAALRK